MWGQSGVTVRRVNTFQSPVVNLGASAQRIGFLPITNLGILRALRLSVPYAAGTVTAGASGLTAPVALQQPQLNIIQNLQIQMAGLTASYNCSGRELGYLSYVGNGKRFTERRNNALKLGYADTAVNTPALFSFPTSLSPASMTLKNSIPVIEYNHTGPVFNFGYSMEIPIIEYYRVPGQAGLDKNGNIVPGVGDIEVETGLLIMQSAAQTVTLDVTLSGLQGSTFQSVFVPGTTGYDLLGLNKPWNLEHDYYDLPDNPQDYPSALQTGFMVSRVARDWPIQNGQADYYFLRGGLLLRSIMSFYNDSSVYNTVVDIAGDATQTPDKIGVLLQDGQSTQYYNETAQTNQARQYNLYGAPSPGILVHDLIADGTLTQAISTADTVALRESLTNLPSSITRMRVLEERLIPVQVTSQ